MQKHHGQYRGVFAYVHEGFQASTGRTILIRVDDIPSPEREDVTQFFCAVQQLSSLDARPKLFGWIGGLIAMLLALIFFTTALKLRGDMLLTVLTTSLVAGVISGLLAWAVDKSSASDQRVKLMSEISMMFGRSERCRIAAEQLRQTSASYAKLLPATASTA